MSQQPPNDPLHGVTLRALLEELVEAYGWDGLAEKVQLDCFAFDPSIDSSLKFLRRTPWARAKVERLYVSLVKQKARKRKRNAMRKARRKHKALVEAGLRPRTEEPEGS